MPRRPDPDDGPDAVRAVSRLADDANRGRARASACSQDAERSDLLPSRGGRRRRPPWLLPSPYSLTRIGRRMQVRRLPPGRITGDTPHIGVPTLKRPPLWLACHEAGHAVARLVLDELTLVPGPYLRSISVEPQDGALGICMHGSRCPLFWIELPYPKDVIHADVRADIVENFAGAVAETHCKCSGFAAMWQWHSNVMPTLESVVFTDDNHEDAAEVHRRLQWLSHPLNLEDAKRLWFDACLIVTQEWPGIAKTARVLRDRGTMDGDEFEDVWRGFRPSVAMREHLARKAGCPLTITDDLARARQAYDAWHQETEIRIGPIAD
jgi:hypothetical protein